MIIDARDRFEERVLEEFQRLLLKHGGTKNQLARRISGAYIRERIYRGVIRQEVIESHVKSRF